MCLWFLFFWVYAYEWASYIIHTVVLLFIFLGTSILIHTIAGLIHNVLFIFQNISWEGHLQSIICGTWDNHLQVETGLEPHTMVFKTAILTRMRWTVNGGVAVHGHRCAWAQMCKGRPACFWPEDKCKWPREEQIGQCLKSIPLWPVSAFQALRLYVVS